MGGPDGGDIFYPGENFCWRKLYARKCLDRKCLREPDFLVRALKFFYVVFSGLLYIDWSSVIFMKPLAKILTSALLLGALAVPFMGRAADPKTGKRHLSPHHLRRFG